MVFDVKLEKKFHTELDIPTGYQDFPNKIYSQGSIMPLLKTPKGSWMDNRREGLSFMVPWKGISCSMCVVLHEIHKCIVFYSFLVVYLATSNFFHDKEGNSLCWFLPGEMVIVTYTGSKDK